MNTHQTFRFHTFKLKKPIKFKSDTKVDQTMGSLEKVLTIQTAAFGITIVAAVMINWGSSFITKQGNFYYKM